MRAALPRRAAAVVVALAALVLALAAGSGPVLAEDEPASVRLLVAGFEGVVGPGAGEAVGSDLDFRVHLENTGAEELRDVRVVVEVFDAVTTRSELHLALDDNRPQARLLASAVVEPAAGGRIAPGAIASADVHVAADRISWRANGVHPVRLTTMRGREPILEVTTAVVHLAETPANPLPVVVGWPLDAAPVLDAAGARRLGRDAARDGRLDRLVRALERHQDVAVQPLVGAHLLEDLTAVPAVGEDAPLGERLGTELARRAVAPVVGPYANADLAGLVLHGLPLEGLRHIVDGARRLEDATGARVETDAMWSLGLTSSAVVRELLEPARIRTLVLSWAEVADPGTMPDRTPYATQRLTTGGVTVDGLVADPWLEEVLARSDDLGGPAVTAQRVLAETALVHLERPNAADRSLLLLPPPRWDPPNGVADALLAGVAASPWLQPVGVGAAALPPPQGLVRLRPVQATTVDGRLAGDIRRLRRELAAVAETVTLTDGVLGGRAWADLDTALLRAATRLPDGAATRAPRLLGEVRAAIDEGVGTVELPRNAVVTLTSVDGTIPITVSRPAGPPVRLRVELRAPARLDLPDGATRELVLGEGARQTITFRTTAQATGRIPVTVRVHLATTGSDAPVLVLAEETLVVRSTAVSRPALGLLGAVLGALAAISWVRRRRPGRPDLVLVHDEAA